MPGTECKKGRCRRRLMNPKLCAKGSFRTKVLPNGKSLVVCCPRKKWRSGRCSVGTRGQSLTWRKRGRS